MGPTASHGATGVARRLRLLARILTLIACTTGLSQASPAISGTSAAAPFTFEQYEVVTGSAKSQTILTGFLLGGAVAELAVVSVDEGGDRRLQIYAFGDSAWVSILETTLRADVLSVDVANIGGRDRLVMYQRGHLSWFDPESGAEQELAAVTSSFDPPRRGEIPHVDVTRDVNGDDRDDLVVPDVDGFRVFIQESDGAFSNPVKIGPPPEMGRILGSDGYRYDPWSQSRIHEIDYNHDGRADLVYWNEDHFEVHTQDERGEFAPRAEIFSTDVSFDSDDLSSLAVGHMRGRVLHSLADLNGDGVADLVVYSLEGTQLSRKRSSYEVHFGAPAPDGGTVFSPEVGVAFRAEDRIQIGMDRHDFDGDGQVDLMFTTIAVGYVESSFFKRIGRWLSGRAMSFGMMGDDIWLNLEFYHMEGDRYADTPDAIRKIALDGVPSNTEPGWVPLDLVLRGGTHESRGTQSDWPRAFNMLRLVGDVTGDRRADLFIGKNTPNGVDINVGVPGPDLFARPQDVPVVLPNDEEYVWLVDLNKDGKQDVLMHHPFTLRDAHGASKLPPGSEPHRVTMLISR